LPSAPTSTATTSTCTSISAKSKAPSSPDGSWVALFNCSDHSERHPVLRSPPPPDGQAARPCAELSIIDYCRPTRTGNGEKLETRNLIPFRLRGSTRGGQVFFLIICHSHTPLLPYADTLFPSLTDPSTPLRSAQDDIPQPTVHIFLSAVADPSALPSGFRSQVSGLPPHAAPSALPSGFRSQVSGLPPHAAPSALLAEQRNTTLAASNRTAPAMPGMNPTMASP
jgi:hypothetical protein